MGILTIILVAVGLPIGHHIARLTKTELVEGEKYFQWAERLLIALIIGVFANALVGFNASIGAGLLALALVWEYPITDYRISGILLAITSSTTSTVAPLILMLSYAYFLVAGTQTYIQKKHYWKPAATYLLVAILIGLLTGTARTLL